MGVAESLRLDTSERALLGVKASFDEGRTIERAFYTALGANDIDVAREQMRRIGDEAARLILETPVAKRKQIPPIIYQIAGKGRLLEEAALLKGDIGSTFGAPPETPRRLLQLRAQIADLETKSSNAKKVLDDYTGEVEKLTDGQRILEIADNDTTVTQVLGQTPDALAISYGITKQRAIDLKSHLKELNRRKNTYNKIQGDIDGRKASALSLENELLPKFETEAAEAVEIGPDGIIDNTTTIDEVLAARGVILDAAARAVASKNKFGNKIATDLQSFIVEDWIQDPAIFGDLVQSANFTQNYDVVRAFSRQLNDKYTRGYIGEFWQKSSDRDAKVDPNQFLVRVVNESRQSETTLPTGSVDQFEASLVKANSPYIIRENGQIAIDFDRPLTPGMPKEGFT